MSMIFDEDDMVYKIIKIVEKIQPIWILFGAIAVGTLICLGKYRIVTQKAPLKIIGEAGNEEV